MIRHASALFELAVVLQESRDASGTEAVVANFGLNGQGMLIPAAS